MPPGIRIASTHPANGSRIRHVAWSPDGTRLAAGLEDGTVAVWQPPDREPAFTLSTPGAPAQLLAWSADGGELAVAHGDGTVRTWDAATRCPSGAPLQTPTAVLSNLWWRSGSRQIVTASLQGAYPAQQLAVETWSLDDGRLLGRQTDAGWRMASIAMSADRRWLVLSLTAGGLEVWDLETGERTVQAAAPRRDLYSAAVTHDRRLLALSLASGVVEIWDALSARRLREIAMNDLPAVSLDFSHDGRLLASRSQDGKLRLRRCETWDEVAEIDEPLVAEVDLAFHPRRPRLATFTERLTAVRLWDIEVQTLRPAAGVTRILFLAAAPDGTNLLRADREYREIDDSLRRSGWRERFDLDAKWAVRPADLDSALLAYKPHIVHFAGHGTQEGAILIEDERGGLRPVMADTLARLFENTVEPVQCVVLNACFSSEQAAGIARSVEAVIGMSDEVGDDSAIAFSAGFYRALGEGMPIERAFRAGRLRIETQGNHGDHAVPVLIQRPELDRSPGEAGTPCS